MLRTLSASIEVLGRVASTALRLSLKKVQNLDWDDVADNPEPLEKHIRAVFNEGAVVLIDIMNKNICREFGLKYVEGQSLVAYINEAYASGT